MKIGLVQFNSEWEDRPANLARAETFIERAATEGCDMVVFPEMFATGFTMNPRGLCHASACEVPLHLERWSSGHRMAVVAGYARKRDDGKGENMALAFDRTGQKLAEYRKMRLFPLADEHERFAPGTEQVVCCVDGLMTGLFICYDLRFPELFRSVARSMELALVIANWPAGRKEHWATLLQARAIENQCFVVGVNRIGSDGNGLDYAGGSLAISPQGEILACGTDSDEFLSVEINPSETAETRARFPFLPDTDM